MSVGGEVRVLSGRTEHQEAQDGRVIRLLIWYGGGAKGEAGFPGPGGIPPKEQKRLVHVMASLVPRA